jgi:hypothetical protein
MEYTATNLTFIVGLFSTSPYVGFTQPFCDVKGGQSLKFASYYHLFPRSKHYGTALPSSSSNLTAWNFTLRRNEEHPFLFLS